MSLESAVPSSNGRHHAVQHHELPAADAAASREAARALQDACHLVAPLYQRTAVLLDEDEERIIAWALDGAVRRFANAGRDAGLPPERVLAELMRVVKLELVEPGPGRGPGNVRAIVFRAFLDAFFSDPGSR